MIQRKIAAVVVNNKGEVLPYTVRSTKEQCEEHANEFFGETVWSTIKSLGGRVAQCEINLLDSTDSQDRVQLS